MNSKDKKLVLLVIVLTLALIAINVITIANIGFSNYIINLVRILEKSIIFC